MQSCGPPGTELDTNVLLSHAEYSSSLLKIFFLNPTNKIKVVLSLEHLTIIFQCFFFGGGGGDFKPRSVTLTSD